MKVSVIVPAFNEERLLAETLDRIRSAMRAFADRDWQTELIVCDNNSTDRTPDIAREAGAIVVFEPVNQIARARNRGAAAATGDWLVFVDADSHPGRELFDDVAGQMTSGRCVAGGSTLRMRGWHPMAWVGTRLWNCVSRCNRLLAGSFIFCEAVAFRAVGGFSQELFVGEELDLSKRLHLHARTSSRQIVILHRHPMLTSDRKMKLYSAREHLRFLFRVAFNFSGTMTDREACHQWYDGRR
ncbi:MAG TPA: glycosyltransferase [Verrucomicrobiota bacterium]|nr:glycosyltransferase [Verrucomicrobiota bacterium]